MQSQRSQKASLDENAVILPVTPSSPEFLYSERERRSVENLLWGGPKAFYTSVRAEPFGRFLSPDEVGEMTSWVQDFHFTPLPKKENGGDGDPDKEDLASSYFPSYSDVPVPRLNLGWPETPWVHLENIAVYTNPPAEGKPSIREVIRRHLQKAGKVLAIVTDRLTDSTIIGDLHDAASRGVPVYIVLNQRTSEKYTFQRLGHPNIQVRLLGGKSFCSSKGKMMVGELKDKFILVDLVTVIHGSYSLTWTDAHLHRQIISVINGSAVDSFDKEFRVLFAASAPVPNLSDYIDSHVERTVEPIDFTDPSPPRHFHMKQEILNPPSPPTDTHLDWEAMGVIPRGTFPDSLEEEGIVASQAAVQTATELEKKTLLLDTFNHNDYEAMTTRRFWDSSPMTNHIPDNTKNPNSADHHANQPNNYFQERRNNTGDRQFSSCRDNRNSNKLLFPPDLDEITTIENKPESRKPLILRVPQSESFNSLSDLMKRFKTKWNKGDMLRKDSRNNTTEITQSMMDLREDAQDSDPTPDERRLSMPRLNAHSYVQNQMTPGLFLMKKRNNEVKTRNRPRGFGLDLNWKPSRETKEVEDQ
ncbi:protein FAM83G [Stigmatopora argus]